MRSEVQLLKIAILASQIISLTRLSFAQTMNPNEAFNDYILQAVSTLENQYSDKGYAKAAYTHPIHYGQNIIPAQKPPATMCVAAVAEVISTAIDIYATKTGDTSVFQYLPADSWSRLRLGDIRSHIWVDHRLDSYGTADALVTFGIGRRVPFSELKAGAFINLNRSSSGHAVIFLSYLDSKGDPVSAYSETVTGFKYFSSQGRDERPNRGAGMGYRYAFFGNFCPKLAAGIKRDCGVIRSTSQKMLNTGYMLMPKLWNAQQRDNNLAAVSAGLYQQSRSLGRSVFPEVSIDKGPGSFNNELATKDMMTLNKKYDVEITTDD